MNDDEITFYIFYTKASWELKDDTVKNFTFAFAFLHTCFEQTGF